MSALPVSGGERADVGTLGVAKPNVESHSKKGERFQEQLGWSDDLAVNPSMGWNILEGEDL